MNTKETVHLMKNNFTTVTTTADSSLDMMSLFDYLGTPAGTDLGKKVAAAAHQENVPMAARYVTTKTYKGKVMLYPKGFLDKYFNKGNKSNQIEIQFPF